MPQGGSGYIPLRIFFPCRNRVIMNLWEPIGEILLINFMYGLIHHGITWVLKYANRDTN